MVYDLKRRELNKMFGFSSREYFLSGAVVATPLEEILLPKTVKSMVTMYHCNSYTDCTKLKATHYCAKQNQPEFLLNLKETRANKFVFDCDMSTELCNSDEDHIHKMIFELSEEESHLKASYLAWKDKKLRKKHSIYHFDRM